jgi:small subunit ribosomal protein S21
MIQVNLNKDEPVERALKRLKRKLDRDDVIKECRNRRYFEKPSAKKRRRMKEAKFKAMLDARDARE